MSFRKRNAVISSAPSAQAAQTRAENAPIPGVRPSPHDSRPTTSTGTASLDSLLAGHSGLPLGTSLLVEEHGTTDFAGVLLRYYAAEGLVQGHQVHVLGLHENWRTELPGLSTDSKGPAKADASSSDKMKIAWRYESLGSVGAPRDREAQLRQAGTASGSQTIFCHPFDLSKRLSPSDIKGQIGFHPIFGAPSPFKSFIASLLEKLASSPPTTIHRVLVPGLLSPMGYSSSMCHPKEVLQFLHALRALLRRYPTQLTALVTLPVTLFPRTTGLTRWMELLSDGVLELTPLQSSAVHAPPPGSASGGKGSSSSKSSKSDEQVQGLLKVHTLPVFHEKGGGSAEAHESCEDQSFSLSRSRGLVIKPFSLPPVGDDEEDKAKDTSGKASMDF